VECFERLGTKCVQDARESQSGSSAWQPSFSIPNREPSEALDHGHGPRSRTRLKSSGLILTPRFLGTFTLWDYSGRHHTAHVEASSGKLAQFVLDFLDEQIHIYFLVIRYTLQSSQVTIIQHIATTPLSPSSRIQAEPKGDHLPHALAFLRGPDLKCTRTRAAFRHISALERTELFRNIQRVCVPALAVANIMLRRKYDQLGKIASACAGRGTDGHGGMSPSVGVERERPLARVRKWSTPHTVDHSTYRVRRRFLP
jgi:hypothetical protein